MERLRVSYIKLDIKLRLNLKLYMFDMNFVPSICLYFQTMRLLFESNF